MASTCGTKALFDWLTSRGRRDSRGVGVGPSILFSQSTAPPGPMAPPPVTDPDTVVLEDEGGVGGASAAVGGARGVRAEGISVAALGTLCWRSASPSSGT